MSFGVMGGDMQPQGHVQILVNLLDFDMGLQEAGDAPRVPPHRLLRAHRRSGRPDGGELQLESGFPPETIRELVRRGHRVTAARASEFGGYQAIWYDARKRRLLRRHRIAQRRRRAGVLRNGSRRPSSTLERICVLAFDTLSTDVAEPLEQGINQVSGAKHRPRH